MAEIYDLSDCGYFNDTNDFDKQHNLTVYATRSRYEEGRKYIIEFDNNEHKVYKYLEFFVRTKSQKDTFYDVGFTKAEIKAVYKMILQKGW